MALTKNEDILGKHLRNNELVNFKGILIRTKLPKLIKKTFFY